MELMVIGFLVVVLLVIVLVKSTKTTTGDQSLALMQQQIDALRKQLADGLQSNSTVITQQLNSVLELVNKQLSYVTEQLMNTQKTIGDRLDTASKVVGDVQKELGSLSQATERVFEVGKDISTLQEILKAPKLRGSLGELFLGDLLSQMLPSQHYTLQYKFKSGEIVDAVIHLASGFVPVDSKFPLENFRRLIEMQSDEQEKKSARKKFVSDVKKHIDTIATKYILPDEGTFDFALMYIPAENVYYETIIKDESDDERAISSYALERRVIPVSPNSFYAYLQAIVLGLKGLKIEKNAQVILEHLQRLKGDFTRFRDDFEILGKHLSSAKAKYDDTDRKLSRFEEKLISTGEDVSKPSLPEGNGELQK